MRALTILILFFFTLRSWSTPLLSCQEAQVNNKLSIYWSAYISSFSWLSGNQGVDLTPGGNFGISIAPGKRFEVSFFTLLDIIDLNIKVNLITTKQDKFFHNIIISPVVSTTGWAGLSSDKSFFDLSGGILFGTKHCFNNSEFELNFSPSISFNTREEILDQVEDVIISESFTSAYLGINFNYIPNRNRRSRIFFGSAYMFPIIREQTNFTDNTNHSNYKEKIFFQLGFALDFLRHNKSDSK